MTTYEQGIIDYYDNCDVDYRLVWHLNTHMAMHYGYWEPGVKRLRQALSLMNFKLAEMAGIQNHHSVLDAGCGVGGSSIYLAQNFAGYVTGITLSEKQVAQCNSNAQQMNVQNKVGFETGNYNNTRFANNTFDVVWAMESVCYAKEKSDFLKEAYRILKPGGVVAVADFFRSDLAAQPDKLKLMKLMADSWALADFEVPDTFEQKLKISGFENIKRRDVSKNVAPSVRRLYLYYYPGVVCDFLLRAIGTRKGVHNKNLKSTLYQYQSFVQGLWSYNFFVGQKPLP